MDIKQEVLEQAELIKEVFDIQRAIDDLYDDAILDYNNGGSGIVDKNVSIHNQKLIDNNLDMIKVGKTFRLVVDQKKGCTCRIRWQQSDHEFAHFYCGPGYSGGFIHWEILKLTLAISPS